MKVMNYLLLCLLLAPISMVAQLEMDNFDKNINPKEDFYHHVNGTWIENTEIPPTEGRWASFSEIIERNRTVLKQICEKAAEEKNEKGSDKQLVGDLYFSAMDAEKINQLGFSAIEEAYNNLDAIENVEDITETIANFQKWGLSTPFYFFVNPDPKNSKFYAAQVWQGGTSLPSRSYYLEDNPRFEKVREAYLEHITNMFKLAGVEEETAQKNAATVLEMEKRFAMAQRSPVESRNPEKNYNKMTLEDLEHISFNFDWAKYLEDRGANHADYLLVAQPEFLTMFDRMLGDFGAKEWATYFKWKMLSNTADYLSDDFVNEDFNFFSKTLRGIQEIQPRWKRMQRTVDGSLGQPLGKLFVAETFPPEAKDRMVVMIENLRSAFRNRLAKLDWMSEATKQEALKKLNAINYKIGYPDEWRDYSSLDINKDDFLGNMRQISAFNNEFNLKRIGQEVDINDWGMSPPTVNAYYSPTRNEIVFPAGILQPPFFDFYADDALNYGAIGAVIGHEITHGFDDQGSQYDAEGNLKMWWTEEDREKFDALAQKIVEQYNSYTVLDSVHVNGQLTLGENIADLGGVAMAYDALQLHMKETGRPDKIDGFTPEQRFFMGFARIWRAKYRDEVLLERIKTDPHSPGIHRCNGTLSNTPAFHEAFEVKDGAKMKKEEVVRIW
ncbi:MAG: M13 family metallopeptidase [Saprospiraceae bacterium]|nr:M13 family metallopeptidase [Saprospiraceae bacterium]